MDQEERGNRIETNKKSSQVEEGVSGNSRNLVNGVAPDTVIVINSEKNVHFSGENADLRLQNDGFGLSNNQETDYARGNGQPSSQNDLESNRNSSSSIDGNVLWEEMDLGEKNNGLVSTEVLVGGREELINEETSKMRREGGEATSQVDQGSRRSSSNSVDGFVVETVIVISTQEAACVETMNKVLEVRDNGLGSSKVLAEKPKTKFAEAEEDSCVIDIKGSGGSGRNLKESWDGDRVCRICHLNTEQPLESTESTSTTAAALDLIQLGCGCKDELGIAHSHCAEAWFKLKGNRICEICGQIAKNITGVRDSRFIEDWNEQGSTSAGGSLSDRGGGCWRGQPFCNFLMACLVIAFVLPWFFRVNMF